MNLVETFFTFGIRYAPDPQGDYDRHPLGMHTAPNAELAPAGELLRIAWIQPEIPAPRVLHRPTHVTEQLEQVEVA